MNFTWMENWGHWLQGQVATGYTACDDRYNSLVDRTAYSHCSGSHHSPVIS